MELRGECAVTTTWKAATTRAAVNTSRTTEPTVEATAAAAACASKINKNDRIF